MKTFNVNGVKIVADSIFDAINIADEATTVQTLLTLINDEIAAVSAYETAISNLEKRLSKDKIKLLRHILDEEKEHVEELKAIKNDQDISMFLEEVD